MSGEIATNLLQFIALFLPGMIIFLQLLPGASEEFSPDKAKAEKVVRLALIVVGLVAAVGVLAITELIWLNISDKFAVISLIVLASGLAVFGVMLCRYWVYYKFQFFEAGGSSNGGKDDD